MIHGKGHLPDLSRWIPLGQVTGDALQSLHTLDPNFLHGQVETGSAFVSAGIDALKVYQSCHDPETTKPIEVSRDSLKALSSIVRAVAVEQGYTTTAAIATVFGLVVGDAYYIWHAAES